MNKILMFFCNKKIIRQTIFNKKVPKILEPILDSAETVCFMKPNNFPACLSKGLHSEIGKATRRTCANGNNTKKQIRNNTNVVHTLQFIKRACNRVWLMNHDLTYLAFVVGEKYWMDEVPYHLDLLTASDVHQSFSNIE